MRKKLYATIFFLLVVSSEIVSGNVNKKPEINKTNLKHKHVKEKPNIERIKRSLDDEEDKPFWANRGKKKIDSFNLETKFDNDVGQITKFEKRSDHFEKEPFWGTRGRRDSEFREDYIDDEYTKDPNDRPTCKNCYGTVHFDTHDKNFKDRRDESLGPFWGNRGRRSSGELEDPNSPFWGNRGRRQENEPFWGTRGRRKDSPFWGARGRREDEPFWGNRGRRDDEPFWGNRGRRQDPEPFWGTKGRRDDEPFWGTRGRREPFPPWSYSGRKKQDLKESIMNAINVVENDIEHLSRLRRSDTSSFWLNRGRDSKLNNLFNDPTRHRLITQQRDFNLDLKSDPGTMQDSRIFAEEPHYIVVERSSRSSGEFEDPYYISRGKKYYLNNLFKVPRDRRGAIEEIVKSVRNDPYYIARGKKDTDVSQSKINSTSEEAFGKAKELICAAIELITSQEHNGMVKREINSDRDRRTILKKLAAQLQIDPYYVSRGKKSDGNSNGNNLREFITDVAEKCD